MRSVPVLVLLLLGAFAANATEAQVEAADIRVVMAPSSFTSPGASYPDRETIDEAVATFMRSCAPLTTEYWSDVVSATATVYNETYAKVRLERYGWRREIAVAVLIKDHPTVIPRRLDVASHTLHFFLGGGTSPGIVGAKNVQALCGMSLVPGGDAFKPVPELALIDR